MAEGYYDTKGEYISRLNPNNFGNLSDVINAVKQTPLTSISIIGVGAALSNTLGSGALTGFVLCKNFGDTIYYVAFGDKVGFGNINSNTGVISITRSI